VIRSCSCERVDYPTHAVKRKLLTETCNKPRILHANFGFETETSLVEPEALPYVLMDD
jgi:hypothetical protein